ncbi:hypothetical protein [Novosphingobium lentum]|uniref:hypothetical protein n=1 Tax=Novosphingobium lentum TaxID=145287 RepID=UPI000B06E245|nr:hypothetical protein [Novosphingobium lentum]
MSALRLSAAVLLSCGLAAPAAAVPGGTLGTLNLGTYFCELPGDAVTGALARRDETFTVVPDSSYRTADGNRGTYLLLADQLVMTTGSLAGSRYAMQSDNFLHKLDSRGTETPLRCVRFGDPAAMADSPPPSERFRDPTQPGGTSRSDGPETLPAKPLLR